MRHITTPLAGFLLATAIYSSKWYLPEKFQQAILIKEALLFLSGLIIGIRFPDIDLSLFQASVISFRYYTFVCCFYFHFIYRLTFY